MRVTCDIEIMDDLDYLLVKSFEPMGWKFDILCSVDNPFGIDQIMIIKNNKFTITEKNVTYSVIVESNSNNSTNINIIYYELNKIFKRLSNKYQFIFITYNLTTTKPDKLHNPFLKRKDDILTSTKFPKNLTSVYNGGNRSLYLKFKINKDE